MNVTVDKMEKHPGNTFTESSKVRQSGYFAMTALLTGHRSIMA